MIVEYNNWTDFKADILNNNFPINYQTFSGGYRVFVVDRQLIWRCFIIDSSEISDFETNYKSNANKCLYDSDGKQYSRAESRPLNCTTCFTSVGDTVGETPSIGTGARLDWDASISEEWTTDGCPEGFKKSVEEIQFCDSIWLKDGTLYYKDVLKNSYIDLEVICPNGGYYMYLGQIQQNLTGSDLVVDHYVIKHPVQGDVSIGDELNTEACSQELPNYLKYRLTIHVPTSDNSSYGYIEFEINRQRTVII